MVKHTLKILQPLLQHFKRVSDHILDSRHHRKKFKNVILAAINEHILFSGVFMINLDFFLYFFLIILIYFFGRNQTFHKMLKHQHKR